MTDNELTARKDREIKQSMELISVLGPWSAVTNAWMAGFESALASILTTDQVGDILGVTPRRVRAIAAKRNVGRQLGGAWFFLPSDVERLRPGKPGRPKKV